MMFDHDETLVLEGVVSFSHDGILKKLRAGLCFPFPFPRLSDMGEEEEDVRHRRCRTQRRVLPVFDQSVVT